VDECLVGVLRGILGYRTGDVKHADIGEVNFAFLAKCHRAACDDGDSNCDKDDITAFHETALGSDALYTEY
jgi:hypothetical protein